METKTFVVPDISCGHCVATVERELGELAGVKSVKADESNKNVTVEWDAPANWTAIKDLLIEIEYPPQE